MSTKNSVPAWWWEHWWKRLDGYDPVSHSVKCKTGLHAGELLELLKSNKRVKPSIAADSHREAYVYECVRRLDRGIKLPPFPRLTKMEKSLIESIVGPLVANRPAVSCDPTGLARGYKDMGAGNEMVSWLSNGASAPYLSRPTTAQWNLRAPDAALAEDFLRTVIYPERAARGITPYAPEDCRTPKFPSWLGVEAWDDVDLNGKKLSDSNCADKSKRTQIDKAKRVAKEYLMDDESPDPAKHRVGFLRAIRLDLSKWPEDYVKRAYPNLCRFRNGFVAGSPDKK